MTTRRGLLTGLVGFVACAPAIVRVASIMPVRAFAEVEWHQKPYYQITTATARGAFVNGMIFEFDLVEGVYRADLSPAQLLGAERAYSLSHGSPAGRCEAIHS